MGAASGRPGPDPSPDREHGTVKGRGQHKRRGEVPCVLCKAARAAHDRERAARHREQDAARDAELARLRAEDAALRAELARLRAAGRTR